MSALDEADVARQDAMVFAWVPYSGRISRPKQPAWGDFFLGIRWKRVERGRFLPALRRAKTGRGENGLARLESHLGEQNRATYRLRILEGRLRRLI